MSDDVAVGRMVHDVRVARNLRQEDVAARAGVGRTTVARLEHGLLENMTVAHLRAISRALEMPSVVAIGWRSPEVDRLRDRLHAAMVEQVGTVLLGLGWQIVPESSFNYYGDRGSADLLAWHEASGSLLIIEIKTRLWDIQDVLSAIDRKWRVMPGVVARARKCRIRRVGLVLVLPELSTHRHVVDRHATTFGAALPQRQLEVRRWLAGPSGDLRGIWFLPIDHDDDIGQRSRRLRASKRRPGRRLRSKSDSPLPNAAV